MDACHELWPEPLDTHSTGSWQGSGQALSRASPESIEGAVVWSTGKRCTLASGHRIPDLLITNSPQAPPEQIQEDRSLQEPENIE